mgnify:CR=1 FL=1
MKGAWVAVLLLGLAGCAGAPPAPDRREAQAPGAAADSDVPGPGDPQRSRSAAARLEEARSAMERGDYRTALEAARAAAVLNPYLREARVLEARALEASGDLPAALERWEGLIRDPPAHGVGEQAPELAAYAVLAQRRGRGAEAYARVLDRLRDRPADAGLRGIAGWLALGQGMPAQAREHLEATWKTPEAPRFALYLGRARLLDGDLAGAEQAAQVAAARPGASAPEWVLLGDVRRAQGLAAASGEAYRRALELDPEGYDARVGLAVLRLSQGDFAGAEELAAAAAALRPGAPEAWTNLGLARRALGQFAGAREAYEKALLASPRYPPALKNLGILHEKYLGRPAQAVPYYDRYLEARPADDEVAQWRRAALRLAGEGQP